MRKCEPKFNEWLKEQGVGGGEDTQKYLLYSPDGERKLIRHSELQALCKKYFGEMAGVAEKNLLKGEAVMTEHGCFSVDVLDSNFDIINAKKPKKVKQ